MDLDRFNLSLLRGFTFVLTFFVITVAVHHHGSGVVVDNVIAVHRVIVGAVGAV